MVENRLPLAFFYTFEKALFIENARFIVTSRPSLIRTVGRRQFMDNFRCRLMLFDEFWTIFKSLWLSLILLKRMLTSSKIIKGLTMTYKVVEKIV